MRTAILSPHFSFNELTDSDAFPGLVNKNRLDASAYIGTLTVLCKDILEPVRVKFGPVVIESGYRCPALNSAVKGEATSFHLSACAADFIVPGHDLDDVFDWIRKSRIPFGELILEPGWIHITLGAPHTWGRKRSWSG